jgi:hypothetical protein
VPLCKPWGGSIYVLSKVPSTMSSCMLQAGILEGVLEGPLEVMDGAYVQNLHGRTTGVAGFDAI